MKQSTGLDRRRFVQMISGASLVSAAGSNLAWAAALGSPTRRPKFAYVGDGQEIRVYSIAGDERFIERQTVPSAHPVAMAISDRNLYVANGLSEYSGLPRGSVEAYAIDASTGQLQLTSRVPLSLSAVLPRSLAVAPDGRNIVVAVHGGGAYNLLSVHEHGRLGRVSSILKETGSGPHASQAWAHPSAVMFDRVGRVLTTDQGSDRLSVLSLTNGELAVAGRLEIAAGSGPTSMALHPESKRLYVAHALNGSISSFGYDATEGRILDRKQTIWAGVASEMAVLEMHPSGEMLYSTHGDRVQAWKVAVDGNLEAVHGGQAVQVHSLHVTADGRSVLALSKDGVLAMKIDSATRALAAPVKVVGGSKPSSIATL